MSETNSCQSCHMPFRNGRHEHYFIGVDIDLSIPLSENDLKSDVQELLETSASLEFIYQNVSILNKIENPGTFKVSELLNLCNILNVDINELLIKY